MDQGELGGPFKNFIFKLAEPHEYETIIQIIEKYLYVSMEPIGYVPEGAEDWNEFFMGMLKKGDNLTYIAVDSETGKIAAVRMVDVSRKEDKHDMPPFKHQSNIDSFTVCLDLCKDENLFEKYNVTEYPELFGLCVADEYRQQGLATEIYARGLTFLKNRGFKIAKCGFISPYTRKAGYKHGYKEFARGYFLKLRNEDGEILNPKADPEGFICFGIFDMRD